MAWPTASRGRRRSSRRDRARGSGRRCFYANVLRQARYARPQAANAAHDEIDLDAGLARLVERIDDLRIDEGVHLHPDGGLAAGLGVADLVAMRASMRVRMPCGLAAITSISAGSA